MMRRYFYPRSPCGERPRDSRSVPRWHAISIHALLAESDHVNAADFHFCGISIHALLAESDHGHGFQKQVFAISIHALLAESDTTANEALQKVKISIHALLAESDAPYKNNGGPGGQFLSTLSLRRATLIFAARHPAILVFLSTLSLRRATGALTTFPA